MAGLGFVHLKVVPSYHSQLARQRDPCALQTAPLRHPYKQFAHPTRAGGQVTLAFCWAHWRRKFVEIDRVGPAPIAHEMLERIAAHYAIESRIRGRSAEERRVVRQTESKPLVEALKAWLESKLIAVSEKSIIAEAIRYGFNHWDGLVQFLSDGRIEMTPTALSGRSVRLPSIAWPLCRP